MKPQRVAVIIAGVGALVVMVGGGVTQSQPELHDAVRAVGLLIMLLAAGLFLAANYHQRTAARRPARALVSSGAVKTARNLMIIAAAFFGVAVAMFLVLHWTVPSSALLWWVLGALMLLGLIGMSAGLLVYAAVLGVRHANRQTQGPLS